MTWEWKQDLAAERMLASRDLTVHDRVPPRDLARDLSSRVSGIIGSCIVRLWGATLTVDWLNDENVEAVLRQEGRVIYTFWHGRILPLAYTHRKRGIVVLVSRHKDGEIISQIICNLGYGVVRGSSTRGGLRALMEMARVGRAGHPLSVTPDGPRGPRQVLQPGVLHIAQRSGMPILPLMAEAVRRTELPTWDHFQIPHPWSRIVVVIGPLIRIPPEATTEELEREWAPRVTEAMSKLEDQASVWRRARTGRP